MTVDQLVQEVRARFEYVNRQADVANERLLTESSGSSEAKATIARRARYRARRQEFLSSPTFRNLAHGFLSVEGSTVIESMDPPREVSNAAIHLEILIGRLAMFTVDFGLSPHQLAGLIERYEQRCTRVISLLREAADMLTEGSDCRAHLESLIREIDGNPRAVPGCEMFMLWFNPRNLRASKKADSAGAWRGWIVRETLALIPEPNRVPKPWATVAELLTWAGIDGVDPEDVGSIYRREQRRRASQDNSMPFWSKASWHKN